MKIMKGEVKTWNSQQSDVDPFSKLENAFLEKFFKYLLTDTHEDSLTYLYEHTFKKKQPDKTLRHLAATLFLTNRPTNLGDVMRRVRGYLEGKSGWAGGG